MNSRKNIDPVKSKAKRIKCEKEHLFFTRAFFLPRMGFKFSVNWHHKYIADKIDEVIAGKVKNLVINVPPGSGKTELLTNLIARGIARNPRSRFLYLSYSQSLVEDVSATARNIVKSDDFQNLWPVRISTSTDAKSSWKTTVDGYDAGHVYSASMGGQVTGRRSRDTDAYNHVQIEYINRYNQYNTETTEAKDQANIEMFGLRTEDPVECHYFCEPKIARHAAQLRLQRLLYVRNEYEFDLGWKYCRLEPMDIVTLTDAALGLVKFPVRITRVEEDEEGRLTITAEELAIGSRSAIEYDLQASNGYQGGNEAPGNVNAPAIFEPPLELTDGKSQVWVAVSGGVNLGGCNVWASLDNTTYEMIGTIYGSARYGQLVTAIDADDTALQVELNTASQIFSGTLEDAQADQTLCKVGDEYFNYQMATLNGSGLYTLSDVLRGRFDDAQSHNAGEQFVRLDKAIFEYSFNENLIGKQIYLKFTSFNGLERKEQTLDEVTAYSYTLSGGRPAGVKGLSLQSPFVGTTFKVQWQSATGADGYRVQVWSNGAMIRQVDTTNTDYSYSIEEAKQDGLGRAYTIRVASKNGGQISTFAELSISNPVPPLLTNIYTSATFNSITVSWIPSEVPDLKDYAVWLSTTPNFDPIQTPPTWTGMDVTTTVGGLQATTPYYIRVAARDVWKDTVWNYSNQITQSTSEA